MRYDDPQRPTSIGADNAPMQVSGSPLPVITLVRPMESEGAERWTCTGAAGCSYGEEAYYYKGSEHDNVEDSCKACTEVRPSKWGWLACIHAHKEGSRFGYHTAWIASLAEFSEAYLLDPEAALARWFKYLGPEERRPIPREVAPSLWDDDATAS